MTPYFRATGTGPAVICIHAGAASSGQWRSLTERLADRFRVIACDLSGSGRSPEMAPEVKYTLDEEVSFLGPVFDCAGDSFHLVGHSFGGAVALKAALRHRGRVRSLTLFEPVLFALLVSHAADSPASREIVRLAQSTSRLADLGRHDAAAEEFIDYWFRKGTWAALRDEVRADIGKRMGRTRQRWDALLRDPIGLPDIAAIDVATLFLRGKNSSLPARTLGELLVQALPRVRSIDIEGVGHMAPLSDPDRVNPLIDAFLQQAAA